MSNQHIDLHSHTTHSDGSSTPSELIARASEKGASAIAITDHDTVDGLAEGRRAAARGGIEFVPGIEISAEYSPGTMHILGYFVDQDAPELNAKLDELKRARERRNPQIAARLKALGLNIVYEEVAALAGSDVVGRPHFATLMLERGYVKSIQDAFDRYLKKGAPAYVEKQRLSPRDSIALIRSAGGVAVLAHPYQLALESYDEVNQLVEELASYGLDGIEAIYSRHRPEQRNAYSEIASRHDLAITGGSDFHGTYKPDIDLLTGLGDLVVPYSLLEGLRQRIGSANRVEATTEAGAN